ncbi:MAG: hypothetical protein FRX49_10401 [Trebouxia sp. A1-2]|nr:MAG: hypothetical protein FRX49_10401 [Trebouxia sp. A1-2]
MATTMRLGMTVMMTAKPLTLRPPNAEAAADGGCDDSFAALKLMVSPGKTAATLWHARAMH